MGSPFRVEPVSVLDRNEDSLRTFPSGWRQAFAMGSPVSGRACFSPRSERRLFLHLPGVWLESSRWGHPIGSILSQISIGMKTLCAPSLVVGGKPSRWGHPFRVVWRFSAHSIGTKASSVHLSFVASRWDPLRGVCVFLTLDRNEVYFG